MRFHGFFETVFGSKVKARVLHYLLKNPAGGVSEREMAKLLGVSNVAVNAVLKEYYDANLVTPQKIGKATAWAVNMESYAYLAMVSLYKAPDNPPLHDLRKTILDALRSEREVRKAVLFGSVARGDEEAGSDIDLGIVVASEQGKSKVADKLEKLNIIAIKRYGNKLSSQVVSMSEKNWRDKFNSWLKEGIVVKDEYE